MTLYLNISMESSLPRRSPIHFYKQFKKTQYQYIFCDVIAPPEIKAPPEIISYVPGLAFSPNYNAAEKLKKKYCKS